MFQIPGVGRVACKDEVVCLKENWDYIQKLERRGSKTPEKLFIVGCSEDEVCVSWMMHKIDPQWEPIWNLVDLDGQRFDGVLSCDLQITWQGHGDVLYASSGPLWYTVRGEVNIYEFLLDMFKGHSILFDKEGFLERFTRYYAPTSVKADGDRDQSICSNDGEPGTISTNESC